MRIMIAGDWHGSIEQAKWTLEHAKHFDCDLVFQLGDFGYWEHFDDGIYYLESLNRLSQEAEVPIYWIDGNHENHPLLWSTYAETENDEGFYVVRDNIFYCPRGNVWEWDGVRFMGVGGAFSVDRNFRKVGVSFWFEEDLTDDDILNAVYNLNGEYVDVMFTHDVPAEIDLPMICAMQGRRISKSRQSDENRERLSQIILKAQPKYLFHGHMHIKYQWKADMPFDYRYDGLHVHGLHEGGAGMDSIWVMDTRDVIDLREKGLVDKP